MKIAVILTCFNRKQKTLSCLKSLFEARNNYRPKIDLHIYLTDDGCTDGTADAVCNTFSSENITILQGDGNLFWAGGMRLAWKAAMKYHEDWDFYLLLNDDVEILSNLFYALFEADLYSVEKYNMQGLYSGITRSIENHEKLTYGGHVFTNKLLNKSKHVWSDGTVPLLCDFTNANIMMIPKSVVDKIGTFYIGYSHGFADYDYSMKAKRKGIPVLLTKEACGACDNDHPSKNKIATKIMGMSLSERLDYFAKPPHKISDYRRYILRNMPLRYPFVCISTFLNVYFPKIYYRIKRI